ncbi:hypothetical protein FJV46_10745 [Arthrobacter agilis]|uniref:hypothetical protein n=1 Tax=Arthrobacter agilis TaxID=37921 RepID=UPI000B35B584|nr:hypothetical protein [Arthrobacter agilis]OUM44146.1 hypothetical protein B8W74_04540 [Arthrobacter agilis]PPB46522.1 hypothetical protein CI784_06835 [Arthrobacter agilis]TPV23822.1 hypothetical protein FJV46_10745 [Arthrobacter agilis]VDR32557.1 Uncharacterised protein [Arthrobacter agilis]
MLDAILQVTGSLALASVSLASAWFVYHSTRKRDKVTAELSKEANAITWSQDLVKRLDKLEDELKEVRADLDKVTRTFRISMNYIERLWQWAKTGSRPPIPDIPESLYEHLDPSLIDEHHRQQREHDASPKA